MTQAKDISKAHEMEKDCRESTTVSSKLLWKLLGLLVPVITFIVCLMFMELVFWAITPEKLYTVQRTEGSIRLDETGRHINYDGVYEQSFVFFDGQSPIHFPTTIKDGRRFTPIDEKERSKFALFFGDSFTFGEGVVDTETLPFYFGQMMEEYRPYNFGVPGGSVQTMYEQLTRENVLEKVKEEDGIAFYWFFGFHTIRAIGGMPAFNRWAHVMSCYELEEGELCYKGNFRQAHPRRALLYDLIYKSNTLRYMSFFPPIVYTPYHYQLTSRLLWDSIQLFKKSFPESEFVILYWDNRTPYGPVKETLDGLGVPSLLVRDWLEGIDNPLETGETLPDGHLKGILYEKIARGLVDSL